jgi:hypothetical protein
VSETGDDNRRVLRFDRDVSSPSGELEHDDDFPVTAWDLASAMNLEPDPADREALAELADAMLVWADDATVLPLTDAAVGRLWTVELSDCISDVLREVAAESKEEDWRTAAQQAIHELERVGRRSEIARAVVERFAQEFGHEGVPWTFCIDCLEGEAANSPPEARRAVALRSAVVCGQGDDDLTRELRRELGRSSPTTALERLGTPARRAAARGRLGRIASLGAQSVPTLAGELARIAAEPLPEHAADDEVWCAVCEEVLASSIRADLN